MAGIVVNAHETRRRGRVSGLALLIIAGVLTLIAATAPSARAASVTNGMIALAYDTPNDGLFQPQIFAIGASGGTAVPMTGSSTAGGDREWAPRWSPDGNTVVYYQGYGSWVLSKVRADGTHAETVGAGVSGMSPIWSSDGQFLYYVQPNSSTSDVQRFDLWRVRADGTGEEKVAFPTGAAMQTAAIAFAPDGRLLFIGSLDGGYHFGMYAVDLSTGAAGQPTPVLDQTYLPTPQTIQRIDVSAAGLVLFDYTDATQPNTCAAPQNTDLYTVPLSGGPPTQLTHTDTGQGPDETYPAWSPDGTMIVTSRDSYTCDSSGARVASGSQLGILNADGTPVRDLGIAGYYGASWQPCTPVTIRCTPPAAATASPDPTPTSSSAATPGAPAGPGVIASGLKTITRTVNGAQFRFQVPRCVSPGTTFALSVKAVRKSATFVRITRVDFSVGGTLVAVDRIAPFKKNVRVPVITHSSTPTVRARVSIKLKTGKTVKRDLTTTVKACA